MGGARVGVRLIFTGRVTPKARSSGREEVKVSGQGQCQGQELTLTFCEGFPRVIDISAESGSGISGKLAL